MHNKPHTEVAKEKIRAKQRAWRKTQSYQDFLERQRKRGKTHKNLFQKGHKIHEKHPELRELIKPYQSGEKHWHWKGGITPEIIKVRNSTKYKEWRDKVFKRDNYTCVLCGKNKCYVEADHFPIPFCKLFKDKNYKVLWNIKNGRTLCRKCHDKTKKHWKKYF